MVKLSVRWSRRFTGLACAAAASPLIAMAGFAQESDEQAELAKKVQNPVAALISVPFQNNFEWGGGPKSEGFKYTLNFQPVIPIALSADWNLISRTIVPIIHQDDVVSGSSQTGVSDILQSLFFGPAARGPGGLTWGAGPALLLPTSTENFLDTEKFGIGPTAVVLRQESGRTYGVLANHLVSIGGTHRTADVNATFLQPFPSYTTTTYTTFSINTESTYDWESSQRTVPLNASAGQLLTLGGQPIQFSLGPKLYVEGPSAAPDWGIRCTATLLFPTGSRT